ncbi:hypothetical protein QYM36_014995 [Artemia franciscana]|uniref:Uncharacterized protein n=1 Tax=Artemia franciscana TaxID=6661 RepID=A0AA88HKM3_ARTSF|nr:hypothetical protein QYM36_014995 [Artemia franciscana]
MHPMDGNSNRNYTKIDTYVTELIHAPKTLKSTTATTAIIFEAHKHDKMAMESHTEEIERTARSIELETAIPCALSASYKG